MKRMNIIYNKFLSIYISCLDFLWQKICIYFTNNVKIFSCFAKKYEFSLQ